MPVSSMKEVDLVDPLAYYKKHIVLPELDRLNLNKQKDKPLNGARNATMLTIFGPPRSSYSSNCQGVTNKSLSAMMVTHDFGPFKMTALAPFINALKKVFKEIEKTRPKLFASMGTYGGVCARYVRGSQTAISNHSFGTAADFTIGGVLDARADKKIQQGLYDIYKIFNKYKLFWGAAFPTEDAMHFEASEQLIIEWNEKGYFKNLDLPPIELPSEDELPTEFLTFKFGDRTQYVSDVQRALNILLKAKLKEDGIFGKNTAAAVLEYQRRTGLTPYDGSVDQRVYNHIVSNRAESLVS